MDIQPKQKLYKTAYSKIYEVYVAINHAHQDIDKNWIYTCSSNYHTDASRRFNDVLHRDYELSNLIL